MSTHNKLSIRIITLSFLLLVAVAGYAQIENHYFIGESVQFEITPLPGISYCWKVMENTDLLAGRETDKVTWLTSKCNPLIRIRWENKGIYFLILTLFDQNGCSNIKGYRVVVGNNLKDPALFFPEAISPNGDGLNDKFVIRGLKAYPKSSLTIYSRDGHVVYKTGDYQNDWGGLQNLGMYNSHPVPPGTYYYQLHLGGTQRIVKGFIYLAK